MPQLAVTGAYSTVELLRAASNITTTDRDAVILEHLEAASREVERLLLRHFLPVTATNAYRWPPLHVAYSWEIWAEDDLLSVSSINVAAAGQGAVPVPLTNYFLEPQQYGPPYNRVEVDLSSSDIFQAGPTPQRSVQITGQWGYCNTTVAAGSLTAACGASDTTISVSDDALVGQGDVLLIDSEAIYVTGIGFTVERGVNGTIAASHAENAVISKYQAPADVRRLVRADAITTFQQDLSSWSRNIGSGEMAVELQGKMVNTLRQRVINNYARRRTAAV